MIIKFDKPYLADLWLTGKCGDKRHRYQPEIIKGYKKCIASLIRFNCIEDLYPLKALNYEALSGDKYGRSSVRINLRYRLEFTITEIAGEQIITICTVMDITNHYK